MRNGGEAQAMELGSHIAAWDACAAEVPELHPEAGGLHLGALAQIMFGAFESDPDRLRHVASIQEQKGEVGPRDDL